MKFFEKRVKKQVVKKDNSKRYLAISVCSFALILPVVLMISTSIQSSHQGSKLSDLNSEIASLEQEVRNIEAEVVEKTSLSDVVENVEEMGFSAPEQLVYIQKENPVAQRW